MSKQDDLNPLAWLFWVAFYGTPIVFVVAIMAIGALIGYFLM
jgi:hypothetical protein